MKKLTTALLTTLGLGISCASNALVIDNGSFTTDTNLGLDYLDVGVLFDSYANFSAGVSYGGKTWTLATAAQLASTWSDITGLALTSANILSGDNDMGAAATNSLLALFDGVLSDVGAGGEQVAGDYGVSGYYQFMSGGSLALHSSWDDSHYSSAPGGDHNGWLVAASGTTSVPEPGSLALLAVGLVGVGLARKKLAK